ncbi:MAG TPA: ABC transporter substrate-binding protein [Pyrinomonadaceae bacterium]|nr:ABC transporter substrate-binding protein [Pyrinomonadaceae bacterium]
MTGEGFYEPVRFSGFPEIKESIVSGHIPATFMLAPLAMKLREQGVPIKIVYLGHRDGTAMMVHNNSDIRSIRDLKNKTIAVPNRYSNQFLIIFKALRDNGLTDKDVNFVEMPPPDMPAALYANSVDAITSGEPFMAKTQMEGYGRVLYQAKDIWPEFISCVLVVREDLIKERPEWVQQLVDGIARSGKWLEGGMERRMKAADDISQQYYNQKPELLRYVLSTPPDRVNYANLMLAREEFEKIATLGREAGILNGSASFEDYTDASFSDKTHGARSYDWEGPK